MFFGRGPSGLWLRLLGRACSWSHIAAPDAEKLTRQFGIAVSHKLTQSPGPNPSESCTNRLSDMGSIPKVFMSKQEQYVLLCFGYGFFHAPQVGCLFGFALASCTGRGKASIKQLLSCLFILLCEAKSKSQQPQIRALKSPNTGVLWPLVQKWLAASQPITGNFLQHDSVCVMCQRIASGLQVT